MSKKQNLEYEAKTPAFLQRLKDGHAALDGRHSVQIPRAHGGIGRNSRLDMRGDDGEDDPVMLDENGEIVTKEQMAQRNEEGKFENTVSETSTPSLIGQESKSEDSRVSSGFGKKRKAAKVIGDDGATANDQKSVTTGRNSLKESTQKLEGIVAQKKIETEREPVDKGNKKSKRKKVKLSFDEPE